MRCAGVSASAKKVSAERRQRGLGGERGEDSKWKEGGLGGAKHKDREREREDRDEQT